MDLKEAEADSLGQTTEFSSRPSNSHWRDIWIVLLVSWAVRLAFICLVPSEARSFDASSWEHQAQLLNAGINPYKADDLFNWPPFWMQFVFVISKIAGLLSVPFFRVLQLSLILIESLVIVQTMRLIQTIAPAAKARAIAMIGIALNPVAILLVCQHCNFDVLMALWVLLATASLLRYNASNHLTDWLCACLFLGLGILTKTVPLALVPLLAGGFQRATAAGRLLGTALVLGPTFLGMSIIFVLAPSAVFHHVLEYRANGFFFGFPGFLNWMDTNDFVSCFDDAFYILGIGVIVLTWRYLWKNRSLGDRETVLYIAVALLAVPVLGPGFGSQYFYWFLPFFVITYATYESLWRKVLIGFAVISAIMFIIDYGLNPAYGYDWLFLLSHTNNQADLYQAWKTSHTEPFATVARWALWLTSPSNQTMEQIPLFIATLTIIFFGARILLLKLQEIRKWVLALAGLYALCIIMIFAAAIGSWAEKPVRHHAISSQSGQSGGQK